MILYRLIFYIFQNKKMPMKIKLFVLCIFLFTNYISTLEEYPEESVDTAIDDKVITYGSSLRIMNIMTNFLY